MRIRPGLVIAAAVLIAGTAELAVGLDGAAIYKAQCAKCHGDTGQSDTGVAKAMKVPALAGDASIQKMSDADLAAHIKGSTKHPAAVKGLNESDLNAVAAHVKQLAGK